uniref:Uncharacterized protein n=1 Tax=Catagonus wagneri TaxID=51154 RepID=A0A8C3VJ26_9CETA
MIVMDVFSFLSRLKGRVWPKLYIMIKEIMNITWVLDIDDGVFWKNDAACIILGRHRDCILFPFVFSFIIFSAFYWLHYC